MDTKYTPGRPGAGGVLLVNHVWDGVLRSLMDARRFLTEGVAADAPLAAAGPPLGPEASDLITLRQPFASSISRKSLSLSTTVSDASSYRRGYEKVGLERDGASVVGNVKVGSLNTGNRDVGKDDVNNAVDTREIILRVKSDLLSRLKSVAAGAA